VSPDRTPRRFALLSAIVFRVALHSSVCLAATPPPSFVFEQGVDGSLWLSSAGHQLIDVAPRLEIVIGRRRISKRLRLRVEKKRNETLLLAAEREAGCARYRFELLLRVADPRVQLTVSRRYTRDCSIRIERLRFSLGRQIVATTLGADYRKRRTTNAVRAGVLMPQQLWLSAAKNKSGKKTAGASGLLLSQSSFAGMQLQARSFSRGRSAAGPALVLELDHYRNHPFYFYPRCEKRLGKLFSASKGLHDSPRKKGEQLVARATLLLGDQAMVVSERLPYGYRAAISFTDHADQSNAAKLEAFAFGQTGALKKGKLGLRFAGFVNRGLRYTKSVFLRQARAYGQQFDSAAYRLLLDEMQRQGVEIGVHSPSGDRDEPGVGLQLLRAFRRAYRGRCWIDHQPYTNCEAISSSGWNRRSRWFMLDALRKTGFRVLWGVPDYPLSGLDMLRDRRRALVYRHSRFVAGQTRFWLFRTSNLFRSRRRFLALFSKRALDRFVARYGLHLAHVYLDSNRQRGPFANKTLLEKTKSGYRLRADVDRLFVRLAKRQTEKQIWVTGIEALIRSLAQRQRVRFDLFFDERSRSGGLIVRATGGQLPRGLTVRLFAPKACKAAIEKGGSSGVSVRVDGKSVRATHSQGALRFVLDGPARARSTIRLFVAGKAGKKARCMLTRAVRWAFLANKQARDKER
jgi:hypothetical protein